MPFAVHKEHYLLSPSFDYLSFLSIEAGELLAQILWD